MSKQLTAYFKELTLSNFDETTFTAHANLITSSLQQQTLLLPSQVQSLSQYLKVLKKLVCSSEVSTIINESTLYTHFISIGERIACGLTDEIHPKMLVYQEHLLGFLANSVTASGDEAFAAQVLGCLFNASCLY